MVAHPSSFVGGKFHLEILRGSLSGGVKQGRGGEKISHFLALSVNISKTAKVTING